MTDASQPLSGAAQPAKFPLGSQENILSYANWLQEKVLTAESRIAQLERELSELQRAKHGTPCKCESWIETCQEAELRAETAEAALAQALTQKSALMEAIEPFVVTAESVKALEDLGRLDGRPRLQSVMCDKKITDKELIRAARVYEQVKEKI